MRAALNYKLNLFGITFAASANLAVAGAADLNMAERAVAAVVVKFAIVYVAGDFVIYRFHKVSSAIILRKIAVFIQMLLYNGLVRLRQAHFFIA